MSFLTASSRRLAAIAAAAASIGLAGNAAANNVTFELSIDGAAPLVFNPAGLDVGGGVFNYSQTQFGPNYTVGWDINAKAFDGPFISGNLVVTNQSVSDILTFEFTVILPVTPAIVPSTLLGGSVAGGLTTPVGGGELSTLAGTPLWQAFIDGNFEASLLDSPFAVSNAGAGSAGIGPAAFGVPIPSEPGPAINDSMSIKLSFSLTPGAQASFTSVFTAVVIPAPGALALFGLFGLVGRGRRRN